MAGARYIRWHFAARRADCAAASSRQAHRRAAVSRRRRLDGEGARRATITWLQMAPPNDAEHMLTILLFFNRRADGARPVHSIRSRRALLTHRAPPSGFGVEAVTRQRVYRSNWRKEAGDERDEPLPAEACRLAAPLERCKPEPLHLVEEPPQARVVARDSEVVQMPFQHLFHPSPGFRDGVVHYPAQLDLDRQ